MRCEDVQGRLSAFLDDELDPLGSQEIQQHLDTCPSCADALGRMNELGERLRAEAPYYPASDSLRTRVTQAAWSEASRGRSASRRIGLTTRGWMGVAAAVIAIVGGTQIFTLLERGSGQRSIEDEVVSSHVRSLMASHLMDVASTDQHTVKPWFAGKLDFSPPVTDLAASGYPLIGGRLDYLRSRTVAALVYQRRKHVINVFTWPVEAATDSRTPSHTQQGYHVIHETHGGMTYWIVSDLNAEELSTFAQLLMTGGATGQRP